VSYFWEARWNKQIYVYFKPDSILTGAALEFAFRIAHPDTFDIDFHNSVGKDLGRYNIEIDGNKVGQVDGYQSGYWDPYPSGPISCGRHFLAEGEHHIRFTCTGKADSARNYWIQPDALVLHPVTYMAPTPGTLSTPVIAAAPETSGAVIQVFPNPVQNGSATLRITLPLTDTHYFQGHVIVSLYDVLGRPIRTMINGGVMVNGSAMTLLEFGSLPSGTYYLHTSVLASDGSARALAVIPVQIE
jgi:hypothetical protein